MRMRSANFDDIFHVTQPNSTTLSSRDDPTSASLPHLSSHPLPHGSPPILVWGEGASKGWCRRTHSHTTWTAALVPQLMQQRRVDSYSFPGVNSFNNLATKITPKDTARAYYGLAVYAKGTFLPKAVISWQFF